MGLNVAGLANVPSMPLTLIRPVEVFVTIESPVCWTERVPPSTLKAGPIVTELLEAARRTETFRLRSPIVVWW
jgi:hypothetical protein